MNRERHFFTSESVTEGHPDKMCDKISDAILDALLEKDPMCRVACETTCTTGLVLVMGEITTSAYVDIQKIVRETVREIGYDRAKYGFDCDTCGVITAIDEQSSDIAMGVDKCLEAKENLMTDSEIVFRYQIYPDVVQRYGYGTKQADWAIRQICGNSSRFAMMYQGEVRLYGDYKIVDGVYYSNLRWL